MGKALYRKYRSKSLSEVVGQEHITKALDNALKNGKISHAYLFTGPRGVGKTSIARILAHEVNGISYDEDATNLDIIEIDAASNRRIDEIRDLRDKVHIAPTSSKYKVYIIDEVHMLTREAFNALLKTLEEPPAHVIFILATTEVHKLPETIVSRTQHYSFRPISEDAVTAHLRSIAAQEAVTIDDEALTLIAQHGGGSFRDSISLLDQVRNYGDAITLVDVEAVLGVAPAEAIDQLFAHIRSGDVASLVTLLTALRQQGINSNVISKQLAAVVRDSLLKTNPDGLTPHLALALLDRLLSVSTSQDADRKLEIVLLEAAFAVAQPANDASPLQPTKPAAHKAAPMKQAKPETKPEATPKTMPEPAVTVAEKPAVNTAPAVEVVTQAAETPEAVQTKVAASGSFTLDDWQAALDIIRKSYNTVYGILRMAQADIEGTTLTLRFAFAFHQKRINDPKNKRIISDVITQVSGVNAIIECIVDEKTEPTIIQPSEDNSAISAISNIFGSAEVLES